MIQRDRVTATLEGDFVIFLIGMRIKKPVDPQVVSCGSDHAWHAQRTQPPTQSRLHSRRNVILSHYRLGAVLALNGADSGLRKRPGG